VVTARIELCLVRHGATDWSDAGRFNGWTDTPLNAGGRAQAQRLASTLEPSTFAGIWCSDLRRAGDTATLAAGGATSDSRLRELDFGDLESRTWHECSRQVQQALLDFDQFVAPNGESVAHLDARVRSFIAGLPAGAHLVFTHGGVIRLLRRSAGVTSSVEPGETVRLSFELLPTTAVTRRD
jgi:2,3-bisphosphoglycerate-dependent phosphoglycerate mutase